MSAEPTPSTGTLPHATGYHYEDHLPADFAAQALRQDARAGLTAVPKSLPPKWFYDKIGSALYEEITRLPEYYPFEAEREILTRHAARVVAAAGCEVLVELGSGSSEKTELLLGPLVAGSPSPAYVALDVSEAALREAAARVAARHPGLEVRAVRADFEHQLDVLAHPRPRLVAFLGSTLGNFAPHARARFLADVRRRLRPADRLLLGLDLVKSPQVLVPAYDDARGVTAAFNRNVLEVLNAGLDADFTPTRFRHVALWNAEQRWIEMRLRSVGAQRVRLRDIDLDVEFADGEDLLTEISAKFERPRVERELAHAGFTPAGWWTDGAARFSLSLWSPTHRPAA
jgi:L-histidine N-alpha-methyltransferase